MDQDRLDRTVNTNTSPHNNKNDEASNLKVLHEFLLLFIIANRQHQSFLSCCKLLRDF